MMSAAKDLAIAPSPTRTAQLCSNCRRLELLGTDRFFRLAYEDEWPAFDGLAQASASGCDFCGMLRDNLVAAPLPMAMERRGEGSRRVRVVVQALLDIHWPTSEERLTTLYGLSVFMRDIEDTKVSRGVRDAFMHDAEVMEMDMNVSLGHRIDTGFLCTNTGQTLCSNSPSMGWTLLPCPTVSVLSERNVGLVQHCIVESEASTKSVGLDLPTRLLDLADFAIGRAKLVISREIPGGPGKDIRYAALSYCWGDPKTARHQSITTVNNLEDRKSGFNVKDLSPVIQDAMQVCSSLSIRFLWVDALCILQGDSQDWGKESQHLGETFNGAHITICAASASSCQERFLQDRRTQSGLEVKLGTTDGGQSTTRSSESLSPVNCRIIPYPISALNSYKDFDTSYLVPFMGDISGSPWLRRGWVHQEIAFSRRLLTFGNNLMFMRCGDIKICENGWQTKSCGREFNELDLLDLHQKPFGHFTRDVERFCDKNFTFRADSLPAMAALARQVHRQTGSQYLAGLWRDNLANDLLYAVCASYPGIPLMPLEKRLQRLSDPDGHARPSWSWVGQWENFGRGEWLRTQYKSTLLVTADNVPYNIHCTVLKAVAEPVNGNHFGAVRRAYLTIRCRMIKLKDLLGWVPNSKTLTSDSLSGSLPSLTCHWDTHNEISEPRVARSVAERVSLICTSQRPNTQAEFGGNMVAGLIVYPAANGEYYRIGAWEQSYTRDPYVCCPTTIGDWPWRTITLV